LTSPVLGGRLTTAGAPESVRYGRWLVWALVRWSDSLKNFVEGSTLRLAPAFDQVSMLYAPTADGQVPARVFAVPRVTPETLDVWDDARDAARELWAQGSADARLSGDARSFVQAIRGC
jgi:hypothetical protein